MIRVSAVVSTYNSSRFMRGCMEDLLAQTLYKKGELEIIVVVSGSQENEEEIVREYQQDNKNILYVRTERETMYGAWNRGVKLASGEYITNANTDDRHRNDALELLSACLDSHAQVDASYGDCYLSVVENETFDQNPKTRVYRYPKFFAPSQVLHYHLSPQIMWRRKFHDIIGYFDGQLKTAGDYDFNLRLALHGRAMHIEGSPIGLYLVHPQALSFKDSTLRNENDRLQAQYRSASIIEELYRRAEVKCDTDDQKAQVHIDMGIRALEYYPPWSEGGVHSEPQFALSCFERAYALQPNESTAVNNLAVAYALLGEVQQAIDLIARVSSNSQHPDIKANHQRLIELSKDKTHPVQLQVLPAPCLQLPSQKDLSSFTRSATG